MTQQFRKRVLTILGAVGYLVALLMMLVDILPAYSVPPETIFLTLATSSGLLGVDYGIDVFGFLNVRDDQPERPHKPNDRPTRSGETEREQDKS